MGLFKTYDPAQVAIGFAPAQKSAVNLNSGIAPDTFLTVARDEDSFTKTVGADGEVARTRNANRSGTIELTLMQNSEVNKLLMALALADEEAGGDVIGAITVYDPADPTGVFLMTALNCWIKKVPDIEYAKEYGTRTWVFDCANLSIASEVKSTV